MAAEGQSHRMVSGMEVHLKQRCGIEFLHVEKMVPLTHIHTRLLNTNGDQRVDVGTVRGGCCISAAVAATVGHLRWYKHGMQDIVCS